MKNHLHLIRLARSQQGSVFILLAVAAMMIVATTGAAVDMSRAQILQSRMQSALDAAGLAAGATASSPPSPLPSYCGSSTWVQCQAQKYFNANFPTGYMGAAPVNVAASLGGPSSNVVTLSASTSQNTYFMKAVGVSSVAVAASSQITLSTSGMELVLVLDNTGSMNSAVNSSNSHVTKINAVISAINGSGGLLDILFGTSTTIPNFWIGVVPFSQTVNIGTQHASWLDTTADASLDFGPVIGTNSCQAYTSVTPNISGTYSSTSKCAYKQNGSLVTNFGMTNWAGCVMARSATTASSVSGESSVTLDVSDDFPTATGTLFPAYNFPYAPDVVNSRTSYTDNPWFSTSSSSGKTTSTYNYSTGSSLGVNMGPNALCPQPLTQMTASRTNISSAVSAMTAGGSTAIDLGMAWGFRMLSPNWTNKWGGEMNNTGSTNPAFSELPLPYRIANMNKVMILMTDGMNEFDAGNYMAYQFLNNGMLGTTTSIYNSGSYSGSAEQVLDNHTLAVCNQFKANGGIIYTIGFGTTDDDNPNSSTSVNGPLLKSCATQNYSGDTSHYFLAPTNAQLASAFQQIAGQLSNLRVSQ